MNILTQEVALRVRVTAGVLGFLLVGQATWAQDDVTVQQAAARQAMRRAAEYYVEQVSRHGGYVYHYDLDLQRRWGEGEATQDQIWVQPPGTPTVGLALLSAYQATGDEYYLQAAAAAAEALCYGQLKSGGWTNCIDFDPSGSRVALYRNGRGRGKNNSSLDDGQTQSAIQFLAGIDAALNFERVDIHQTVQLALDSLLQAQFPCGAFPQVWSGPRQPLAATDAADWPRGNFPTIDWRNEGKIKEYWTLYTLNDDLAVHVAGALRTAYEVYQDERYLQAWRRLGDFLSLAQMPAPQPAWAQQYNFQMQPVWARKFEPPAISGHESQGAIGVLLDLYSFTRDPKYLRPIPAALAYLQRSQLSDGQLARYYELQTNRPLYMERTDDAYRLTYDDRRLPDHYGWKVPSQVASLSARYAAYAQSSPTSADPSRSTAAPPSDQDQLARVRALIAELDAQGRWLSQSQGERLVGQKVFPVGTRYLSSAVFSRNLTELAEFVK